MKHKPSRFRRTTLLATIGLLVVAAVFIFAYKTSDHARHWTQDLLNSRHINAVAIGSSSIMSLPLDYFEQCTQLARRGFGGGTLDHLSLYLDFSLLPDTLDWVLVYAGENDIVYGDTVDHTIANFRTLSNRLTERFPEAQVVLLKAKLSPARFRHHAQIRRLNEALLSLEQHPGVTVIGSILSSQTLPQYYLEDGVHLNRKGYRIFLQEAPRKC